MYHCLYCNIFLRKGNQKISDEHESGIRHKMNKTFFFKKKYSQWLETTKLEICN
jgi:hypothetical protein